MKALARTGALPCKFANCEVPMCQACSYGKAKRTPWRTKAQPKDISPKIIQHPGDCVSVDQMESRTPGLIAQLKGTPMKARYVAATVFVDHVSRFSYVHLMKDMTSAKTLKAKLAFEAEAAKNGVAVKHYHCDNGRFADNAWKESCELKGQTISYCGVDAHFANGIAERRIGQLTELARTQLIHAQRKWSEAINAHLWPYALRIANDVHNHSPHPTSLRSPVEIFTGTRVLLATRHFHHFGAPVYVLHKDLAGGKKIDKWTDRAKIGVYLGKSPMHS